MKPSALRLQPLLLGTLFFACLFVVLPVAAHAQTAGGTAPAAVPPTTDATAAPTPTSPISPIAGAVTDLAATGAFGPTGTLLAAIPGASTAVQKVVDAPAKIADCASDIGNCLLNTVAFFILGFANFMLFVVGVFLNWVVVKTVFQFSTLVGNSAGLLVAWGILRDIGNLVLLFGFVLMGISIILDTGKLSDKKAIPKLIIFAILLNFSIFAAEAIIDSSNVLTSVLYAQANTDPCATETCDVNHGIAGKILTSTGLSGIYAVTAGQGTNGTPASTKLTEIFGLTIFSLIGTVVLLATGIMLLWRAILLTGLIILSPIGFAGMTLPPLEGLARRWWNALIHQSFFAPILFLLIFLDLKVTDGFSSVANNNSLASALAGGGTSNTGIILIFALISGGLIAALMAAKKFGAAGASFATNTARGLVGKATGAYVFGGGGLIARNTAGRGAAALSRGIRSSDTVRDSRFGRFALGITDKAAGASYDGRSTKTVGAIAKFAKVDLGKVTGAAAKGFTGIEKRDIDARVKHGKSLTRSESEIARKEELEKKVLPAEKEAQVREQEAFGKKSGAFKQEQVELEKNWEAREKEIDTQAAELEAKVAENAENRLVIDLDQQIAAEKLNTQRLATTGNIGPATAASATKIQELEAARQEYVDAQKNLTELRDTKTKEFEQHQLDLQRIDAEAENVGVDSERSKQAYTAGLEGIQNELDSIDPQKRYEKTLRKNSFSGGRVNEQAANRIASDLKKTESEKALDAIKKALEGKEGEGGAKDEKK